MGLFSVNINLLMLLGLAEAGVWIFMLVQIAYLLQRFPQLIKYCRNPDGAGHDAIAVLPLIEKLGRGVLVIAVVKALQLILSLVSWSGLNN